MPGKIAFHRNGTKKNFKRCQFISSTLCVNVDRLAEKQNAGYYQANCPLVIGMCPARIALASWGLEESRRGLANRARQPLGSWLGFGTIFGPVPSSKGYLKDQLKFCFVNYLAYFCYCKRSNLVKCKKIMIDVS